MLRQAHPASQADAARGPGGALWAMGRRSLPVVQLLGRRITRRKSPFQVTFSLTNRCNFRCAYCHIPLQERAEMTTDEWRAAIDEFADAGMGRASFMGGEPLLRRDVPELVEHVKRRGVHASLNTNGWLVPQYIDALARLDLVCLTLDGPPEVHDAQRHPGSYARVLEALELLRGRGTKTVTMTVLTSTSIDTVDHVLEVARRFGAQAFFQLEHDAAMDAGLPIAPDLSRDRVAQLTHKLAARKREGWPVGNSLAILEAQRDRRVLGGCDACYAGTYFAYVFSDGTVSHCLFTHRQVPVNNGRERGFLRAFLELAAPEGPGCSCVPSHEVNRILDFDPGVLRNALATAIKG
jgi:MoaA/NifB/PqqE/SkfB family radical SAM enzyme